MPAYLPEALSRRLSDDEALVRTRRLQPGCRSRLWAATGTCKGVVLLLHGFTAGPWQFEELGPKLAARNITAFAARLPGHGASAFVEGKQAAEDGSSLPRSRQQQAFGNSARAAWAEARDMAEGHGVPLYLIGHSAGGAMALDLLRHSDAGIERAVLVAPLLKPKRRLDYALVQLFGKIPLMGIVTDRVRLSWPQAVPRPDGWVRPGHRRFSLGNVVALFGYAGRVRRALAAGAKRGESLAPIQFLCTVADDKVDLAACIHLAQTCPKRHFLHCFGPQDAVPHAMLTAWENPRTACRVQAHDVIVDFLCHGRGSDNWPPKGPALPNAAPPP